MANEDKAPVKGLHKVERNYISVCNLYFLKFTYYIEGATPLLLSDFV